MSYKFAIGVQDTGASAVYLNGLSAVSASVVSGSDFKGKWVGEAITSTYINDVAASKITGQLAASNIAASGVTQHTGSITALGTLTALTMSAGAYANWGSTTGTSGYGFRDNGGTLEFKNSGGSWSEVGSGTATLTGNNIFGANSGHLHQVTGTLAVSGSALASPALYVSSSNYRVGVGTNSPTHNFDVNGNTRLRGGVVVSRRTKTSAYTLAADDYIIGVGSGSTGISLALPDASTLTAGQVFVIKDEYGHAATNNITISASTNGQTIDGKLTITLDANRAAINVYTDGSSKYYVY